MTDKIRLLFRKDRESYLCFYRILGFFPRDIEIYKQALLHKSLSVKSQGRLLNNERLEFLGDAILDAVVGDIVYKRFPGKREGFLTNTRSKIVQRETLNRVAVQIGLDKLIKYTTRQSSHNSYLCGNAFEALVGAIYLDRGYDACMEFMEKRIIANYLNIDRISQKEMNFKSRLIEWGQKNKFSIEFTVLDQSLDDEQNPTFTTQVVIEGIAGGEGKGYSKKESQQEAARFTLSKIKKDSQFIEAIYAAKQAREEEEEARKRPTENVPAVIPVRETTLALAEIAVEESVVTEKYDDVERIISEAENARRLPQTRKRFRTRKRTRSGCPAPSRLDVTGTDEPWLLPETDSHVTSLDDQIMVFRHDLQFSRHLGKGNRVNALATEGHHPAETVLGDQVHGMASHAGGQVAVVRRGAPPTLDVSQHRLTGLKPGLVLYFLRNILRRFLSAKSLDTLRHHHNGIRLPLLQAADDRVPYPVDVIRNLRNQNDVASPGHA